MLISFGVQAKDYTFHTVFVYNFTKYIQWPSQGENVLIGVVGGDSEAMQAFEKMAKAKSGSGKNYIVKKIMSPPDADACHLIFVPENESDKAQIYAAKAAGKGQLVVTEKEGYSQKGGMINFITKDGKLRFELNQEAINRTGLKVSSQLLGLAIVV
jgi:hypothetical protein